MEWKHAHTSWLAVWSAWLSMRLRKGRSDHVFVAGMLQTGFGQTVPGYGPPPGYGPTIPGYGPDTSVHGPQPGYSPMPPGYGSQPSGPGPSTVGPSAPYTDFGVV